MIETLLLFVFGCLVMIDHRLHTITKLLQQAAKK